MTVTQYIGSRYVPLFADPIDWDKTKEYEPLTIVSYQGNSYTSRQAVPSNVDIANEKYWALTGNYNAQVESYRSEVKNYQGQVTQAVENVETKLAEQDAKIQTQIAEQDASIKSQIAEQDASIKSQIATQKTDITNQLSTQDSKVTTQLASNKEYVDTEVGKVSNYRDTIVKCALLNEDLTASRVYDIGDWMTSGTTVPRTPIEITAGGEKHFNFTNKIYTLSKDLYSALTGYADLMIDDEVKLIDGQYFYWQYPFIAYTTNTLTTEFSETLKLRQFDNAHTGNKITQEWQDDNNVGITSYVVNIWIQNTGTESVWIYPVLETTIKLEPSLHMFKHYTESI